jgi:parvulin-like peptidyl-prolyl isomerase
MLKTMRENTKTIMWIVVVAFVGFIFAVWGKGMQRSRSYIPVGVIGKVNGRTISDEQYREMLRMEVLQFREDTGQDPSPTDMETLEDRAWSRLVSDELVNQEIVKSGISVSDELVFQAIWNSPPPEVLQSEYFQTEGEFDVNKYRASLRQNPDGWKPLESVYRQNLAKQILQQRVIAGVYVSELELREKFSEENEKARVSYVFGDPLTITRDEVELTEDAVESYYAEHKDDFTMKAHAKLNYVEISKAPSEYDETRAENEIMRIKGEIEAGEDFADLATSYSDDLMTADTGGDLGFFARGTMTEEFEELAFSLEPGGIGGPVRSQYGYHLVKVEEKKTENDQEVVRARHILVEVAPSDATIEALANTASELAGSAAENGLQQAAEEFGYEMQTTPAFTDDARFVPGVGIFPTVVNFALDNPGGTLIPRLHENEESILIFEVGEKVEERVPKLEEIRDRVEQQALRELQRIEAERRAERIVEAIRSGDTLEGAAAHAGLEVNDTGLFARGSYVQGIGKRNEFVGAAFALQVGDVSGVVTTNRGAYVLRLEERVPFDENSFQLRRDALLQDMRARKQEAAFSNWLSTLWDQAEIEDFRDVERMPGMPAPVY